MGDFNIDLLQDATDRRIQVQDYNYGLHLFILIYSNNKPTQITQTSATLTDNMLQIVIVYRI